jgi:hypothetical protein
VAFPARCAPQHQSDHAARREEASQLRHPDLPWAQVRTYIPNADQRLPARRRLLLLPRGGHLAEWEVPELIAAGIYGRSFAAFAGRKSVGCRSSTRSHSTAPGRATAIRRFRGRRTSSLRRPARPSTPATSRYLINGGTIARQFGSRICSSPDSGEPPGTASPAIAWRTRSRLREPQRLVADQGAQQARWRESRASPVTAALPQGV